MIRKIVSALLVLTSAGFAQSITGGGIATQFNQWRAFAQSGAYGNTNITVGTNTISVNPCQVQGDPNHTIPVFAANTPIKIVDQGTPSLSEVFTPTTVTNGGCTATFTAVNAHGSNYYFASGTFGLQEAINNTQTSGALNAVVVDYKWHNNGGGAATIYGLTGGSALLTIEDTSIKPEVIYRWSGTHYVPNFSINGTTAPTLAAGAAAGTAPTISNNAGSSGNSMTANVTTGTATTTGTLFTETVTTAPAISNNLNCVVNSVGANSPPAFTWSATPTVLTVTVAVAPPTATAYVFNASCD